MEKSIAIVGGDLRIVKLVEMLVKDNYKVYTYGLEMSESLLRIDQVEMCPTVSETIQNSRVVVGPIPLSSDRKNLSMPFSNTKLDVNEFINSLSGKTLIAGNISEEVKKELSDKDIPYIDLLRREEFAVLNAIATAEGAIQIAMEETQKTVHGSKVLVMGFGRTGKILAKMLDGLGAKVYCEARKNEDFAWIKAYGYETIELSNINEHLGEFDIIISTIPFQILDKERLKLVRKDAVIIDIASNPGGVDRKAAKENNLKLIWALTLPGKVAPITSATYIKETLYHVLKEL